jgi:hypothetical protein
VGWGETEFHLVRRPLFGLFYQPRMIHERRAVSRMRISRRNRSTRRKPAPLPVCPPQILHDLTWAQTRAACGGKPATNRLSYNTALILAPKKTEYHDFLVGFISGSVTASLYAVCNSLFKIGSTIWRYIFWYVDNAEKWNMYHCDSKCQNHITATLR